MSWDDDLIPGRDKAEDAESRKELRRELVRIERFVDRVMRKAGLKVRRPSSQSRRKEPPGASSRAFLYDSELLALSQDVLRRRRIPSDLRNAAKLAPLVISLRSWFNSPARKQKFPTWTFTRWMASASAIAPTEDARKASRSDLGRLGAAAKNRILERSRERAVVLAKEMKKLRPVPRIGVQVKKIRATLLAEELFPLSPKTIHDLIKNIVHKDARLPGRPPKDTVARK